MEINFELVCNITSRTSNLHEEVISIVFKIKRVGGEVIPVDVSCSRIEFSASNDYAFDEDVAV